MATPKLALIPTGYKAGKVYSVLPESGVGDFAFTRASAATRTNSAGLLEVEATGVPRLEYPLIDGVVNGCPSLLLENQATNLITYPISFGNSYWTKSGATIEGDPSTAGVENVTDGDMSNAGSWALSANTSISAGVATMTANGIAQTLKQVSLWSADSFDTKTIKLTYTITANTLSVPTFKVNGFNSTDFSGAVEIPNTAGTHSVYIYVRNSASTDNSITFFCQSAATTGAISFTDVSVKEVQGYSSPSVDFPTSAFKLVEGTNTGSHAVYIPPTTSIAANTDFTVSAYVKAFGRKYVAIGVSHNSSNGMLAQFNLETKTLVFSGAVQGILFTYIDSSISEMTDGWFRITLTGQTTQTSFQNVGIAMSDDIFTSYSLLNSSNNYTGDGTSGAYVFMAQLEQGSYATSPTLTSLTAEGTTTTRVAEVCNGAGNASTFNDSEGVLMAEISALADDSSIEAISLSDGTGNNRVVIFKWNTSNAIRARITSGGSSINLDFNVSSITDINKIAIKYKTNDFALWINGIEVRTNTSGANPIGLNLLGFTSDGGTGAHFYGKTKQIQYFNTVLTSAELETLTSWTSFIAMANAQQYNII